MKKEIGKPKKNGDIPYFIWVAYLGILTMEIPKFGTFPATLILREINFRWSKAVALTIMKALNFEFSMKNLTLESIENSQKFKIQSCSNGQNGSFWDFKMTSINLT